MPARIDIWIQTFGLGHITRQLNLVHELIRQGFTTPNNVRFFPDSSLPIQQLIIQNGFSFISRPDELDKASELIANLWRNNPPDIFILDTVDHDCHPALVKLLQDPAVISLAIIDDPANRSVHADLVANVLPSMWKTPPPDDKAEYLMGKDYFILAREFADMHASQRIIANKCTKGVAFFGGVDGNHFTPTFLDAIETLEMLQWTLIVGALYPHREWLQCELQQRGLPVQPVWNVESMAHTLFEYDIAVIAAGNALVETAAVGTPTIAFAQNEIQFENAAFFARNCGIFNMGLYGTFTATDLSRAIQLCINDEKARIEQCRCLKGMIDGLGAQRVANALRHQWAKRRTLAV